MKGTYVSAVENTISTIDGIVPFTPLSLPLRTLKHPLKDLLHIEQRGKARGRNDLYDGGGHIPHRELPALALHIILQRMEELQATKGDELKAGAVEDDTVARLHGQRFYTLGKLCHRGIIQPPGQEAGGGVIVFGYFNCHNQVSLAIRCFRVQR